MQTPDTHFSRELHTTHVTHFLMHPPANPFMGCAQPPKPFQPPLGGFHAMPTIPLKENFMQPTFRSFAQPQGTFRQICTDTHIYK